MKIKFTIHTIYTLLFLVALTSLNAQISSYPYEDDFEDYEFLEDYTNAWTRKYPDVSPVTSWVIGQPNSPLLQNAAATLDDKAINLRTKPKDPDNVIYIHKSFHPYGI